MSGEFRAITGCDGEHTFSAVGKGQPFGLFVFGDPFVYRSMADLMSKLLIYACWPSGRCAVAAGQFSESNIRISRGQCQIYLSIAEPEYIVRSKIYAKNFGRYVENTIFVGVNDEKMKTEVVEAFTRYMQARHMRKTVERYQVLDRVLSLQGHFVIDRLLEREGHEGPAVSRATVYNTVGLLVDCGILRKQQFAGQATQYEVVWGIASHHHLVCTMCGKVREIKDVDIARAIQSRHYETFFPAYFSLNIYGLCSRCQRKARGRRGKR